MLSAQAFTGPRVKVHAPDGSLHLVRSACSHARDQPCEAIAGASRRQANIARDVVKHAAVRRRNPSFRAFEDHAQLERPGCGAGQSQGCLLDLTALATPEIRHLPGVWRRDDAPQLSASECLAPLQQA
jgi:hypothetical protein